MTERFFVYAKPILSETSIIKNPALVSGPGFEWFFNSVTAPLKAHNVDQQ